MEVGYNGLLSFITVNIIEARASVGAQKHHTQKCISCKKINSIIHLKI